MLHQFFQNPIEYTKGVGPLRAEVLKTELGIFTTGDLLFHFPYRYVDRSRFYKINELNEEMPYVQLRGKIVSMKSFGAKRATRITAVFKDESGMIDLVWFAGITWVRDSIKAGVDYVVFGKPTMFNSKLNIVHPEMETFEKFSEQTIGNFQPMYSTTEKCKTKGLDSKGIMRLLRGVINLLPKQLNETLPQHFFHSLKLMPLYDALVQIHFPEENNALKNAVFRFKFEELFYLQLKLLLTKQSRIEKYKGKNFENVGDYFNSFYKNNLPFALTDAQKRVIKEIRKDTNSGHQMNRLLQGDVGSGKTIVALLSMLLALDNGCQACLMAPTEILAQQHFASLTELLRGIPVQVELLTGSTKNKNRREILQSLAENKTQILIGTHALIEDRVQFNNLGLVVIDEQHRFGVAQRAKLWTRPSQTLPEGKGFPVGSNQDNEANSYGYQTARKSSYGLIKSFQEERIKKITEAEAVLWSLLKGKKLEEYKFRRQHVIDNFIVDFVCLQYKLIIEIDGGYHGTPEMIEADKIRTEILNSLGFEVIRFKNEEVLLNTDAVLKSISNKLTQILLSIRAADVAARKPALPLGEESGRGAPYPHVLVMTATPIPRTLAMTLYGDLDVSVIDQMPPGRKPIKTIHYFESARLRIFGFMKEQIKEGRQIYVVYPLIDESEKLDFNNLMSGYDAIVREFPLPQYQVSIVHGRMKPKDKEYEMQQFVKGKTNIMVATTVIEVGVNVPNASVMIVESAERFGLSQLHQLRGRVGRGANQSYCILLTGDKLGAVARERMQTMVRTNDGFEIAETDLRLRGPGDITGTQQSGLLDLKIAELGKDQAILELARKAAIELLSTDAHLENPENKICIAILNSHLQEHRNWSRVS